MNRTFLFLILLVSFPGFSQDLEYVREHALTLSSSEMKGRGYVGQGLDKAAKHICKEFENLGLEALPGGYEQEFRHPVNTFPKKMTVSVEGVELQAGIDFLVDPACPSFKGELRAKVLKGDALRELRDPSDFAEASEGSVLVLDMSEVLDKEKIQRAREIKQRFSDYMPVIWSSNEKLTWAVSQQQAEFPVLEWNRPELLFDGALLEVDISARHESDFKSKNVIGKVEGTLYPDSFVFFTAHYDHLGMMGEEACFYGANDNASGTAFIMSLAKHYAQSPPEFTAVFIAFAGEEAGLLGSRYFVENPLVDLRKISLVINMDLMASGIDGITVVNAKENDEVFQKMLDINESEQYLPKINPRAQAANSDHYFFAQAGVPAVFIYALGGSSAYHDIHDVGANLTFDECSDIFRLLTDLVEKL